MTLKRENDYYEWYIRSELNKDNKFTIVWSGVSLPIKKVGQDTGYCLGPAIKADDCHNEVGWPDPHSTWSRVGEIIVVLSPLRLGSRVWHTFSLGNYIP